MAHSSQIAPSDRRELQPTQSRAWNAVGASLAVLLQRLPRGARFEIVRLCARPLGWILPYTRFYRTKQRRWEVAGSPQPDTPAAIALDRISDLFTRHGLEFDPVIEWQGLEVVRDAYARGNGVLLIGPHTMLNRFALRWLHDANIPFAAFSTAPFRLPGTLHEARTLPPSRSLFRVRSLLKSGAVVPAMIDRVDETRTDVVNLKIGGQVMKTSNALVKLAVQHGSPVLFFASKLNDRGYPLIRFAAARSDASAAEVMTQFGMFLSALLKQSR